MRGKAQGAHLQEGRGWDPLFSPAHTLDCLPWGFSEARTVGLGEPAPGLANSGPQAKEKELDFGNMLVKSKQSRMLVLLNDGNCTLYYRLSLEQCSPEVISNDPPGTWAWAGAREVGNEGHWLS